MRECVFLEFQVSPNMYIQPQTHCQLKISNSPLNESFIQDPSGTKLNLTRAEYKIMVEKTENKKLFI